MKIFIIFAFVALASARSYSPSSGYDQSTLYGYGPQTTPTSATMVPIPKPVSSHHGTSYGSHEESGHYNHNMHSYAQKPLNSDYMPYKPKAAAKPVDVPVIRIHYGLPESARHAPTPAPFSLVSEHAPVIKQHKATTNTKTNVNRVNAPAPAHKKLVAPIYAAALKEDHTHAEVHGHPVVHTVHTEAKGQPAVHTVHTELHGRTGIHTVHTDVNGHKAVHTIHTLANATGHPVVIHKELHAPTTPAPKPEPKSAPAPAPFIPTLRFDEEIKEGSYHSFEFEAANGIHQKENTSIVYLPESDESSRHGKSYSSYDSYDSDKYNYEGEGRALITKTGSYSYISPEGKHIHMSYVADKDGFRPVGDHIPTSPSLPEANVRAAAAHLAALSRAHNEESEDAEVEHDHHDHHDAGNHAEHAAQAVHAAHASHAIPHAEEVAMAAREAQEEHRVRAAYAHSAPVRH